MDNDGKYKVISQESLLFLFLLISYIMLVNILLFYLLSNREQVEKSIIKSIANYSKRRNNTKQTDKLFIDLMFITIFNVFYQLAIDKLIIVIYVIYQK